jgi:hypothetical protein
VEPAPHPRRRPGALSHPDATITTRGRQHRPNADQQPPDERSRLAGVTISRTDRIFVNIPRWIDEPAPSVAEVAADGSLIPYPNEVLNAWNKSPGQSARDHFVSVQSVVVDDEDSLWILDPASPYFRAVVRDGPKLVRVNLSTNEVLHIYHFDQAMAPVQSYLNDVRFAHGHA